MSNTVRSQAIHKFIYGRLGNVIALSIDLAPEPQESDNPEAAFTELFELFKVFNNDFAEVKVDTQFTQAVRYRSDSEDRFITVLWEHPEARGLPYYSGVSFKERQLVVFHFERSIDASDTQMEGALTSYSGAGRLNYGYRNYQDVIEFEQEVKDISILPTPSQLLK